MEEVFNYKKSAAFNSGALLSKLQSMQVIPGITNVQLRYDSFTPNSISVNYDWISFNTAMGAEVVLPACVFTPKLGKRYIRPNHQYYMNEFGSSYHIKKQGLCWEIVVPSASFKSNGTYYLKHVSCPNDPNKPDNPIIVQQAKSSYWQKDVLEALMNKDITFKIKGTYICALSKSTYITQTTTEELKKLFNLGEDLNIGIQRGKHCFFSLPFQHIKFIENE